MATWKIRYESGIESGGMVIPPKEVPEGATVSFVDHVISKKAIDESRICYHHGFAGGTIERGSTDTFYTITVWGENMDDINYVIQFIYKFLEVGMTLNFTLDFPDLPDPTKRLKYIANWILTGQK